MSPSLQQFLNKQDPGGTFSSLCILPKATQCEALESGEKIVMLLRRHIATNLWWILLAFFLIFVPLFLPLLPVISLLPANYLFVLILFWYALVIAFAFEQFVMWFFSVNIVTDDRVIDVDFYGLLFKHVSVADLDKIEDVNYFQKGVLGSFFNFGDVLIQTAAEITEFVFEEAPNPDRVTKILSELIQEEKKEKMKGQIT